MIKFKYKSHSILVMAIREEFIKKYMLPKASIIINMCAQQTPEWLPELKKKIKL